MAQPRQGLHDKLLSIKPGMNVYFQPPEDIRLTYPCIVYNYGRRSFIHADNSHHWTLQSYEVKIIDRNPDTDLVNSLETMFTKYCRPSSHFVSDGLHHFVYSIFY